MEVYTDYCTCFYVSEENKVYFYDEIKDHVISTQMVFDEQEAFIAMQIWQNDAPRDVICQILNNNLEKRSKHLS